MISRPMIALHNGASPLQVLHRGQGRTGANTGYRGQPRSFQLYVGTVRYLPFSRDVPAFILG